jgi:hypothetical protein
MVKFMIDPALEIRALHDMAEHVLLAWLAVESPTDRRRQKAIELLADAGQLLHSACINLGAFSQYDEAG